jgi:hypothetical protein
MSQELICIQEGSSYLLFDWLTLLMNGIVLIVTEILLGILDLQHIKSNIRFLSCLVVFRSV